MVKIRLAKTGARNAPSYRIVAIDSRRARDSKALEILGYFNPSHNPPKVELKKERIKYWRGVGAQMTTAVEKLIKGEYQFVKYEGSKEGEEKEKEAGEAEQAENKETSPQETAEKGEEADKPS